MEPFLDLTTLKNCKYSAIDNPFKMTFIGFISDKDLNNLSHNYSVNRITIILLISHLCLRELEHNNLTEVNKGWLYGLRMLRILRVSQNAVSIIRPDAWEFCQKLEEL